MSKTSNLPIYKSAYDILFKIMNITHHFPREYKYTLGEKIQNEIIDMMVAIYKIYNIKGDMYFEKLQEHIELTFLYLRISHDMKLLSVEKYAELVENLNNVIIQANGWQKASKNKTRA